LHRIDLAMPRLQIPAGAPHEAAHDVSREAES
jgi:hypothetical protein